MIDGLYLNLEEDQGLRSRSVDLAGAQRGHQGLGFFTVSVGAIGGKRALGLHKVVEEAIALSVRFPS